MALAVTNDPAPVISSLVKLNTGPTTVSAESYISQAIELFESGTVTNGPTTQPAHFIRAYAIHLAEASPGTFLQQMQAVIEGRLSLYQLDICSKAKLQQYTRQVVATFLSADELQTDLLLNLAQQYFADFRRGEQLQKPDPALIDQCDEHCKTYIAYVLLDFAQADKNMEAAAFRNAFTIAAGLGLKETLKELIKKELNLSEQQFTDRYKKTLAVYA